MIRCEIVLLSNNKWYAFVEDPGVSPDDRGWRYHADVYGPERELNDILDRTKNIYNPPDSYCFVSDEKRVSLTLSLFTHGEDKTLK